MEVYGQTGYAITVKRDDVRLRRVGDDKEQTVTAKPVARPYDNSVSYLKAVIMDGAKEDALSSLDTNVTVIEILDAARKSAAEGRTIRLPSSR